MVITDVYYTTHNTQNEQIDNNLNVIAVEYYRKNKGTNVVFNNKARAVFFIFFNSSFIN